MSKKPPETVNENAPSAATPAPFKKRPPRRSRRYKASGPDRDWREKAKGQIAIRQPARPSDSE